MKNWFELETEKFGAEGLRDISIEIYGQIHLINRDIKKLEAEKVKKVAEHLIERTKLDEDWLAVLKRTVSGFLFYSEIEELERQIRRLKIKRSKLIDEFSRLTGQSTFILNGEHVAFIHPIGVVDDFTDFLSKRIRSLIRTIKSLLSKLRRLILDKRARFRSIVKLLFKNLDDEHSAVNNLSKSALASYLQINKHYEQRKFRKITGSSVRIAA